MSLDLFFVFTGEGKADYEFLIPVIERMLRNLLPQSAVQGNRIDYVEGNNQTEKIINFVKQQRGYQLLFFHHDADSSGTQAAYDAYFAPAFQHLQAAGITEPLIPVIPVRNTEAWLCADFVAFQETIGTDKSAEELGFPAVPHQVETIQDTKALLREAISRAKSPRRRPALDEIYRPIAERIKLDILRKIPAYQMLQQHTIKTLKEEGYKLP